MTDAPERIFAWVNYDGTVDGEWLDPSFQSSIDTPTNAVAYVRADIHDALRAEVARAAGGETIQSVEPPATDPFPPILSQADYECSDTWMRDPDFPPGWWAAVGMAVLAAIAAVAIPYFVVVILPALLGMVF